MRQCVCKPVLRTQRFGNFYSWLARIISAIHDINVSLKSQFNVFYPDDGTLGGPVDDVKADVMDLEKAASEITCSLTMTNQKSSV